MTASLARNLMISRPLQFLALLSSDMRDMEVVLVLCWIATGRKVGPKGC